MKSTTKHFVAILLIVLLIFTLCACGDTPNNGTQPDGVGDNNTPLDTPQDDKNPDDSTQDGTPKTVTVTFHTDGGTSISPMTLNQGSNLTLPTPPTKDEFAFAGWFVDSNRTNPFVQSNPITQNTDLYAKWTPIEKSEFEYKTMFENELPALIEEKYNAEMPVEFLRLNEVKILSINYNTGDIYFSCFRQNLVMYNIATNENVANAKTNKELYENVIKNKSDFTFSDFQTVQTNELAQQIAEFALAQEDVIAYFATNNIDVSNYIVLNATKFVTSGGRGTTSTIHLQTKTHIISFAIFAMTGAYQTQEEYVNTIVTEPDRYKFADDFVVEEYKATPKA